MAVCNLHDSPCSKPFLCEDDVNWKDEIRVALPADVSEEGIGSFEEVTQ